MTFEEQDANARYLVLVNTADQYSLWPGEVAVPDGWKIVKEGTRTDCRQFVDEAWSDIRPVGLR